MHNIIIQLNYMRPLYLLKGSEHAWWQFQLCLRLIQKYKSCIKLTTNFEDTKPPTWTMCSVLSLAVIFSSFTSASFLIFFPFSFSFSAFAFSCNSCGSVRSQNSKHLEQIWKNSSRNPAGGNRSEIHRTTCNYIRRNVHGHSKN